MSKRHRRRRPVFSPLHDRRHLAPQWRRGLAFEYLEPRTMLATLQHSLFPSDGPQPGAETGYSVAADTNYHVVGSPRADSIGLNDVGMVEIFNAATGALLHTIINPERTAGDRFGHSVAVSGNLVVVGDYLDDAVAVDSGRAYVFNAATGALVTTLVNPSPSAGDWFGIAVAISGNSAVVTASREDVGANDSGRAYVFNATTGALIRTLNNPTPALADEFGNSVAISGNTVVVGAWDDDTGSNNAGQAYIFNASTGALTSTLNNPSPAPSDFFGTSVAISGTTVVVGAYGDDAFAPDSGRAYVFSATTGALSATLNNPTPDTSDSFGLSVAVSGNTVVVGAYRDGTVGPFGSISGQAYAFDATTGGLTATFNNPTPGLFDSFGYSVAIAGNAAVVGANWDDTTAVGSGRAYVFDATTGALSKTLDNPSPPATLDYFGVSVSVSGNRILVGAYQNDTQALDSGLVYLYDAVTGELVKVLSNPAPAVGDRFGVSVAVSGDIAVVGVPLSDAGGTDSGRVFIFNLITGAFIPVNNPTPNANDQFGISVAISGDKIVVGVHNDDANGVDSGLAYLFNTSGTFLATLSDPTPNADARYGRSVAVSGNTVVVGAYSDNTTAPDSGQVHLFNATSGAWLGAIENRTPAVGDLFGYAVAISGNTIVIGAFSDDQGATDSGQAYIYDTSRNYIATLANPTPAINDQFGFSVATDGTSVVVGGVYDDTGATDSGQAYVFDAATGALKATIANPTVGANDVFGNSVAVSGNTVVVGALGDETEGNDQGAAYVFALSLPTVVSTDFAYAANGVAAASVRFSEPVAGAATAANYEFRSAGVDRLFDTVDDVLVPITTLSYEGTTATLNFSDLPPGAYRLKVKQTITNLLGGPLDGDKNGISGGDFVRVMAAERSPLGLDPTFGSAGTVVTPVLQGNYQFWGVAVQSDGKIIAVGGDTVAPPTGDFVVVRFNVDGSLDSTFGVGGKSIINFGTSTSIAFSVAIQSDGKIVVGGNVQTSTDQDFGLTRLLPDGTVDEEFGDMGRVVFDYAPGNDDEIYTMALQSDGRIVAVGRTSPSGYQFAVARFMPDGDLDETFGNAGRAAPPFGVDSLPYVAVMQPDDKLVVVGYTNPNYENLQMAVVRYLPDGQLDPGFGDAGRFVLDLEGSYEFGTALSLLPDGRILVLSGIDLEIVRLLPDGTLDPTFSSDGLAATRTDTHQGQYGIATLGNGSIAIAGQVGDVFGASLLSPDGVLDYGASSGFVETFQGSDDSQVNFAISAVINGRTTLIVVGGVTLVGHSELAIARYVVDDPSLIQMDFNYAPTDGMPIGADAGSNPRFPTILNDEMYFVADFSEFEFSPPITTVPALWKTNGTGGSAELIKAFEEDDEITSLARAGDAVFFTVNTDLWTSDGTAAGTKLVKDFYTVSLGRSGLEMIEFNGFYYFQAGEFGTGAELWRTDGTTNGTTLVAEVPGGDGLNPTPLGVANGSLYFAAGNGTTTNALWKTNGTAGGTVLVQGIEVKFPQQPIAELNGQLYFLAHDSTNGSALWRTDAVAGAVLVKDPNPTSNASDLIFGSLFTFNGAIYFGVSDGVAGNELWKSDGTTEGTALLKDINLGVGDSVPYYFTVLNGLLYFTAINEQGDQVWVTDGTADGTTQVSHVSADRPANDYTIHYLTEVNGRLFFSVNLAGLGYTLWQSDGTNAGTGMSTSYAWDDADPFSTRSQTVGIDVLGFYDAFYFVADDGVHGLELQKLNVNHPGDYDGDGDVDGRDFLTWQRRFGEAAAVAGTGADGNVSGVVEAGDLTVWQDHYGEEEELSAVGSLLSVEEEELGVGGQGLVVDEEFNVLPELAILVPAYKTGGDTQVFADEYIGEVDRAFEQLSTSRTLLGKFSTANLRPAVAPAPGFGEMVARRGAARRFAVDVFEKAL